MAFETFKCHNVLKRIINFHFTQLLITKLLKYIISILLNVGIRLINFGTRLSIFFFIILIFMCAWIYILSIYSIILKKNLNKIYNFMTFLKLKFNFDPNFLLSVLQ